MKATNVGDAVELRRGTVERTSAQGAQYFKVSGEIEADGTGEAVIAIILPVLFVDKPAFSFGPELGPGGTVTAGQLPVGNCCVLKWHTTVRDDGSDIFSGADLAIVTSGPTGQVMIIQWHMEGIGLRNPVPNVDD